MTAFTEPLNDGAENSRCALRSASRRMTKSRSSASKLTSIRGCANGSELLSFIDPPKWMSSPGDYLVSRHSREIGCRSTADIWRVVPTAISYFGSSACLRLPCGWTGIAAVNSGAVVLIDTSDSSM